MELEKEVLVKDGKLARAINECERASRVHMWRAEEAKAKTIGLEEAVTAVQEKIIMDRLTSQAKLNDAEMELQEVQAHLADALDKTQEAGRELAIAKRGHETERAMYLRRIHELEDGQRSEAEVKRGANGDKN